MFRWLAFFLIFGLTTGWVIAAPPAGAKSKKSPAADNRSKEPATDVHKVRRGETLWGIARMHAVSVGAIMDLNHLGDSTVRDGQTLKIPRPGADPALAPAKATTHIVAKGETFRGIARKFGLTLEDLERANPKIDSANPKAGAKLVIPATVNFAGKAVPDPGKPKPSGATHTVAENDTYYTIARKYGVTEDAIASANPDVNPGRLRPGSKLSIPMKPAVAAKKSGPRALPEDAAGDAPSPSVDPPKAATRPYVISPDETPETISEAFHISVDKLYELNGRKPGSPLQPGSEIRVPNSSGAAP